jgi:hypothetical protein
MTVEDIICTGPNKAQEIADFFGTAELAAEKRPKTFLQGLKPVRYKAFTPGLKPLPPEEGDLFRKL